MLVAANFNAIHTRLESAAIGMLRPAKTQVEADRAILGLQPPGVDETDSTDAA